MKKYFIATLIITSLFVSLIPLANVKASSSDPVFTWAKQLVGDEQGSNYPGYPSSLAEDSSGNIYMIGTFSGTVDFDPGVEVFPLTSAGQRDTYILKLDSEGYFMWAKSLGGGIDDRGISLSLDSDFNVYVTGDYSGTVDFDPGVGDFPLTSVGSSDAYILKLDSDGNFIWAESIGGESNDGGSALSLDSDFNVYVTGDYSGTVDFDPGVEVFPLTSAGQRDTYILKLDSEGYFMWAKSLGGGIDDRGISLSLDSDFNVYVTGDYSGTVDFDPGVGDFPLTSVGSSDAYILKLDSDGNFIWAESIGGESNDGGSALSLDSDFNVYVTGIFTGTVDFNSGEGEFLLTPVNGGDSYILKLDSDGNFIWAKSVGGESSDNGQSIYLDSDSNLYTVGYFQGTVDFDSSEEEFLLTSGENGDSYILKLDSNGNFIWAGNIGGESNDGGYPYTILISGNNIYIAVEAYGISDMDPSDEVYNLDASISGEDSFILKLSIRDEENPQPTRTRTRSSGYASPLMLATFQQEQLQRAINAGLDTTPYQTDQTINTTTPISRTLKYGMQGDEVKALQVYLNTHNYPVSPTGVGSLGNETTYFGLKTKQAVIKFQLANGLVGDGIVGSKTKEKMK